jgi:hypothetical protein
MRHTTEQRLCLVQLYFKYESARKCRRKFQRKFTGEPVPSRQNIHNLVNKLKKTGSLPEKKTDRKGTVQTEKTFVDIGARLETSPRKFLEMTSAGDGCFDIICTKGHKIVKLRPYKTTVVHALKYMIRLRE